MNIENLLLGPDTNIPQQVNKKNITDATNVYLPAFFYSCRIQLPKLLLHDQRLSMD
jgi:hypothetical protein